MSIDHAQECMSFRFEHFNAFNCLLQTNATPSFNFTVHGRTVDDSK